MNPGAIIDRPSITETVDRYISLRKSGKEFIGLCPFHSEKTPSFFVNEEKGVFICRGCGVGGDVFRFIEQIENLSFSEALKFLNVDREPLASEEIGRRQAVKMAGAKLAEWANDSAMRVSFKMREHGDSEYLARKALESPECDRQTIEVFIASELAAWDILETLQEDLLNPTTTLGLWRERATIEGLLS